MSSLLCLSHLLLNSNGAAQNKQTKNCQESQVIALPGNEYPESPAVFLANSKQTPNFRIPRGGGDCSETLAGILPVGSVTKKANCLWLLFVFCNEGTFSISIEQELLRRRREDKEGDGVKWFVKEQQPSRLSFAHFQFQIEGSLRKKKWLLGCLGVGTLPLLNQQLT